MANSEAPAGSLDIQRFLSTVLGLYSKLYSLLMSYFFPKPGISKEGGGVFLVVLKASTSSADPRKDLPVYQN